MVVYLENISMHTYTNYTSSMRLEDSYLPIVFLCSIIIIALIYEYSKKN